MINLAHSKLPYCLEIFAHFKIINFLGGQIIRVKLFGIGELLEASPQVPGGRIIRDKPGGRIIRGTLVTLSRVVIYVFQNNTHLLWTNLISLKLMWNGILNSKLHLQVHITKNCEMMLLTMQSRPFPVEHMHNLQHTAFIPLN